MIFCFYFLPLAPGSSRFLFQSPTGLRNARDFTPQGQLTETNTAQTEVAVKRARPSAEPAPVPEPHRKLLLSFHLDHG
jgi:hypothetical protein